MYIVDKFHYQYNVLQFQINYKVVYSNLTLVLDEYSSEL